MKPGPVSAKFRLAVGDHVRGRLGTPYEGCVGAVTGHLNDDPTSFVTVEWVGKQPKTMTFTLTFVNPAALIKE